MISRLIVLTFHSRKWNKVLFIYIYKSAIENCWKIKSSPNCTTCNVTRITIVCFAITFQDLKVLFLNTPVCFQAEISFASWKHLSVFPRDNFPQVFQILEKFSEFSNLDASLSERRCPRYVTISPNVWICWVWNFSNFYLDLQHGKFVRKKRFYVWKKSMSWYLFSGPPSMQWNLSLRSFKTSQRKYVSLCKSIECFVDA